jgi:hypothetical protein
MAQMSWENEKKIHSPETCGDLGDSPNPTHDYREGEQ